MEYKMEKIKHNLNVGHDRKKHYVGKKTIFRYFKVGEHVFLKVKEKRISLRLGIFANLAVRYCGYF
jgi:hypothetical protein